MSVVLRMKYFLKYLKATVHLVKSDIDKKTVNVLTYNNGSERNHENNIKKTSLSSA